MLRAAGSHREEDMCGQNGEDNMEAREILYLLIL
jgi:hypothetical protein